MLSNELELSFTGKRILMSRISFVSHISRWFTLFFTGKTNGWKQKKNPDLNPSWKGTEMFYYVYPVVWGIRTAEFNSM